jgi:hypothetical protein
MLLDGACEQLASSGKALKHRSADDSMLAAARHDEIPTGVGS